MDKILLIIKQEYISRVKNKTFLITTFLTPILIGGIYALSLYLSLKAPNPDEQLYIKIVDESGFVGELIEDKGTAKFETTTSSLYSIKERLKKGEKLALLYIPAVDLYNPKGIEIYTSNTPSLVFEKDLDDAIKEAFEKEKMERLGLKKATLDSLNTDVEIIKKKISNDTVILRNTTVATIIGTASGIMIYTFIMIYGAQVMRAVMQEKTSKIVEILISSVKPFQLMLGKIIGVALVGLTQLGLWIIFSLFLFAMNTLLLGSWLAEPDMSNQVNAIVSSNSLNSIISQLNIPLIFGSFIYFFLTGYLFYAALFAMVGASVDSESDTQQFMLPIMLPVLASIMLLGYVIKEPNGDLAFWLSILPFSSPILMMVRIPFDVPTWQLVLSMLMMILGFIATTWMASRVYRIGILMHGSKVNYKILFKWLMSKG